mgnify:CR=1 FL=1
MLRWFMRWLARMEEAERQPTQLQIDEQEEEERIENNRLGP